MPVGDVYKKAVSMPRICFNCAKEMPEIPLDTEIDMILQYREMFPDEWTDQGPALVCDDCFRNMDELHR